jgi:ABC-type nitrate/sulfonate/bicarbonate transport system substrate-binding protein
MKTLQCWTLRAAFPVVLSCTIGAPASAQQPATPIKLTVVETTPATQDLPFVAAMAMADKYAIKIEAIVVQGGGEAGQVFLGDQGDMLLAGGDKVVGLDKHDPGKVKIIACVSTSSGWALAVPADSPIKSIGDLKGKNVSATGPGSTSEMFVRWGTTQAGLNPDRDISIIALGSLANLQAALENQKVDASAVAGPILVFPLKDGKIRLLGDWAAMRYPGDCLFARTKDVAARHADFLRFMQLYMEATERVKTDRAYAVQLMKDRLPKNFTAAMVEEMYDYSRAVTWPPMDGRLSREQYENGANIWKNSGRFTADDIPKYEAIVDNLVDELPKR